MGATGHASDTSYVPLESFAFMAFYADSAMNVASTVLYEVSYHMPLAATTWGSYNNKSVCYPTYSVVCTRMTTYI